MHVQLAKDVDLTKAGSLTIGGAQQSDSTTVADPIVIKHFDNQTLDMITGVDKDGKPIMANKKSAAGDYVTGLDNKDWNVTNPEYVSGRAATEDQLKKISDAVNDADTKAGKHTVVTVNDKANATEATPGKGDYGAYFSTDKGNLLIAAKDNDGQMTYNIKLNDQLAIGQKGENGVDGRIGVNGQDGSAVVINGADGSIGLNGKAGANGLTIKGAAGKDGTTRLIYETKEGDKTVTHETATLDDGQKYAGDFGNAAVKLNKTVTIKGTVKEGAKETDFVDGNIAVVASQDGDNGKLLIKLNKDLDLTDKGSLKMGDTTINNGGITILYPSGDTTKTVSLTNAGLDNGGNRIINVAPGKISATSTDAVNGSQLHQVKVLAEQHTIVEAGSSNITVTPGTNTDGSKKYTVDLAKKVTFGKTADGDKTVAISGSNGTVTAGTGDNKVTVDGSKGQIVAGGDNGVKIGKIADGDSSLTIYDKDGNKTDKKADGDKYVTNLDNKTWNTDGSYVSGRAATEDQLHQVESNVNQKFTEVNNQIKNVDNRHTEVTVNGGTAAKNDGSYTDGNLQIAQKTGTDGQKIYDLKLSDNLNIGGKDGQDGKMGIKGADGKDGVTIKGGDGENGTDGHIGINGKDGTSADIHVKNGQNGVDGTDGHGGTDGMDRVVYEDHNGTPHEVATMDDGMKYGDDFGNTAKVKLNHQLDIVGDINAGKKDGDKKATKDDLSDGNIGIIATDTTYNEDGTVKENGKMTVKLAKDLKGLNSIESNSVTTGNTTINNGGLTIKTGDENRNITVQDGNVNMGGNQIHNVAPGQAPGDAVNVSQLNATNYAVNKLGTRVNRVGAGAAALAALHPLDFDPDDKWDFAAGYGNYKDASAVAVGAYYRPNEDTMFSVGGSFGGGENMVNAGVSFKVGQGNHVSTSRVAMAKEIKDLRQDVANLNAIVNRQSALIDKLTGTNAGTIQDTGNDLFPDVPANHWAYEYVTKLKQAGILTGYPDGNFDGDRMMTRYEFAAIVYRAIMAGAASNPALNQDGALDKLAKEFSPEMKYIRIDTIAKDKNGKPTIERVRVIPEAQQ